MKKLIAVLSMFLLMLCFYGCGGESAEDNGACDEVAEESQSAGDLGTCYVSIGDFFLAKDYNGNDIIIINYEFTNNGEESTSFMAETITTAYQDGVEIEANFETYSTEVENSGQYDSDSTWKNIQPGTTITVQEAFTLANTTSDIIVEVEPFLSFDDLVLTKTFVLQGEESE